MVILFPLGLGVIFAFTKRPLYLILSSVRAFEDPEIDLANPPKRLTM